MQLVIIFDIQLNDFVYRYELGGTVPYQLSLLHAAVAPLKTDFQAYICTVFSVPELAHLVRKLLELTHTNSKVRNAMK